MRRATTIFSLALGLGLVRVPLLTIPVAKAGDAAAPGKVIDAADLLPYFQNARTKAAASAFALKSYDDAVRLLAASTRERQKIPGLELVYSLSLLFAGQHALAASKLDALAGRYPLLADHVRFFAARAYILAGNPRAAVERGELVSTSSVLYPRAQLLVAEALFAEKKPAEAETKLMTWLTKFPQDGHRHEARFRLAEARVALGRPDIPLLMSLWAEVPLSWGKRAEAFLTQPEKMATASMWMSRGMELFDGMRNTESEQAFANALTAPGTTSAIACEAKYYRAQSVFKQRNRTRAEPLFAEAVAVCQQENNRDLAARALYQQGRCQLATGNNQLAAETFVKAETTYPEHTYADDARLRTAEAYSAQSPDDERIESSLSDLAEKFPQGDMRQEALFRLAFRAWQRNDMARAMRALDDALRKVKREDIWYAEGRTLYWRGRVLDRIGRSEEAMGAWEQAAANYPLSYYAYLSLRRLEEKNPSRMRATVSELRRSGGPASHWTFQPTPPAIYDAPAFHRAVELSRLGLGREAQLEMASLGIRPVGRQAVVPAEQRPAVWLQALLLDRAKLWHLSHTVARYALKSDWDRTWPGEATSIARQMWEVAYPTGFASIVEPAARQAHFPAALIYAFTREESSFDPLAESFANAMGLLQMMVPTAKRFAEGGERVSRERLQDPAYNIKVGLRWLRFLTEYFQGHPALIVSAHNAGEGAVLRWLKERGSLAVDEWVETIPYDETRNYTKRVLASFFAYTWLDSLTPHPFAKVKKGGVPGVPAMSLVLPDVATLKAPSRPGRPAGKPGKHKARKPKK